MSGLFVDDQEPRGSGPNWKKISYHAKSTFAVLLSLAVLIGAGLFGYRSVHGAYLDWKSTDDYLGPGGDEIVVTVPRGATVGQIGWMLVDADVVKSKKAWDKAVRDKGSEAKFDAGRFKMRKQMSAKDAVNIIGDPKNIDRVMVTIPEGLRMSDQWPLIAKGAPKITVKSLQQASKNTKALGLPGWAKAPNSPEGFLFPETYEVDDTPTAPELLRQQVAQFNQVTTELNFEDRAKSLKLTPMQALVIASIAEKEIKGAGLPMVTGVFMNRIAKGMPLQSDATVVYANNIKGRLTTTDKERASTSPYNTYRHKGLPPGPISNPGKAAMSAALNPTKHNYLYFVVVDPSTGKTEYNTTLAGHNKSVAKFHAWCKAHTGQC